HEPLLLSEGRKQHVVREPLTYLRLEKAPYEAGGDDALGLASAGRLGRDLEVDGVREQPGVTGHQVGQQSVPGEAVRIVDRDRAGGQVKARVVDEPYRC